REHVPCAKTETKREIVECLPRHASRPRGWRRQSRGCVGGRFAVLAPGSAVRRLKRGIRARDNAALNRLISPYGVSGDCCGRRFVPGLRHRETESPDNAAPQELRSADWSRRRGL